ncbi:hypothetical protein [Yoonia sp. 208BN28-4]|uniref:hypothetical protein n=1 Tax=Yoonia sp. 208BN28-4 TaxID=3126505 RepID=UPI0030A4BF08
MHLSKLFFIVGLVAPAVLAAQEAQVTETRQLGQPEFYENTTSVFEGGSMLSLSTSATPVTVIYRRVAGEPLTDMDAAALATTAYVCDGFEMIDKTSTVTPDVITFSYRCITPDQ